MKRSHWILIGIFAFTLSIRLYLAFQNPYFDYSAYYQLRQIEAIREGYPLYDDPLSFGGRKLVFPPFFYYFLYFFTLFFPLDFVAKVIPNILISLFVFIAYFIVLKITNNEESALFTSFISAFIPIVFSQTINSVSVYSLVIPLTFLSLFFFMDLDRTRNLYLFLFCLFLLILTHSSSFIFIFALFIYFLISYIEESKFEKKEISLFLFGFFFFLWANLIFYKNALLKEGFSFIYGNIPQKIFSSYFYQVGAWGALLAVGLIPLFSGIYLAYRYLFRQKNKEIYLLISLLISPFLFLFFGLIRPEVSLMFIGSTLAVMFGLTYKIFFTSLTKTKLFRMKNLFLVILLIIFVFNSFFPSLSFAQKRETPSSDDVKALLWLKSNVPPDSTILATLEEGFLITYFGQKKNFIDENFFLIPDINQRFNDLERMFITPYQIEAVGLMNKYHINYLYYSPRAKEQYGKLKYLDEECFHLVYNQSVEIYLLKCMVKER